MKTALKAGPLKLMTKFSGAGSGGPVSSAKTQKAPSVVAQYGPSMARSAPQALHRFKFVSSLTALKSGPLAFYGRGDLLFFAEVPVAAVNQTGQLRQERGIVQRPVQIRRAYYMLVCQHAQGGRLLGFQLFTVDEHGFAD